ncbi:ATP-binding cassette sub-family C member 5 isoform X1 [Patella vulgata]|uniref:ATP-binding cassette sub-family C member 5 isoform X1 n=1 Tax=Patella vulgata TaxID=6465 RepID=UPI002180349B|nr:ATP-binding cassette sub-family C member 5 isoform X1 [Patella vulgata]
MEPNGSCVKINFPLEETRLTSDSQQENILQDITFTLKKGKTVGICGSVGCGKSSFISAILNRMDIVSGTVAVKGSIAYVPQQAWIMNSTARENILFGFPYDKDKYDEVVSACCLKDDFDSFVSGDMTEIGERGMNLSGGQKQRISLARAVYSEKDIILLDDPLSAVDIHVGQHIFTQCLQKLLKNKTVVFVTHQLQYLPECDEVIYLRDGQIAGIGKHEDLMTAEGEYYSLVNLFNTEQTGELDKLDEQIEIEINGDIRPRLVSVSKDMNHDSNMPPLVLQRTMSTVSQAEDGVQNGKKLERQFSAMSVTSEIDDDGKLIMTEESDIGSVNWSVFTEYFRAMGGYILCFLVFLIFVGSVMSTALTNWYLSYWLNQGSGNTTVTVGNVTMISKNITDHPKKDMYMIIYSMFIIVMAALLAFRTFIFMKVTLKASSKLHDNVFLKIFSCPMSFFDTTPVGRIINRFSADMDEIDIRLPMSAEVFMNNILSIIFSLGMIAFVSPWFLLALVPLGAFFVFLYKLFVKCVRELKREDSITRSPLISHLTATIQGIMTIKAYNKDEEFLKKFRKLLDLNSVPYLIFYLSNRWLALRLDLITMSVNALTGLLIILTFDSMTPAMAGLALSFAVQMTGLFQFTIRLAVDTESRFTSVQRILDYSQNQVTETTANISDKQPSSDWPKYGQISFNRLRMRYREGLPLALKGITFDVKPQEKIGIVGRSGSGKSSLGMVLFRLVEAASGSIIIDSFDISKVSLEILRSRLSIIPQDPVLFVGTIRYNLDPFGNHSDKELWEVLEKCHVKETIVNLDQQLDAMVIENGENFSVGERQLMCMARALLRHSKILILDEATAAIDTEKDALIQTTIKEAFADCTMLTIAHRLNTVLSCDRILVIEDGKVAEYDKPSVLMSRPDSKFKTMLEATEKQQTM